MPFVIIEERFNRETCRHEYTATAATDFATAKMFAGHIKARNWIVEIPRAIDYVGNPTPFTGYQGAWLNRPKPDCPFQPIMHWEGK